MVLLASFAAAAAAAVPQPTELKTFQDWTVGCDNGASCHAVALIAEDWPDDGLTMSVRRGPASADAPVLAFAIGADSNAASVSADGRRLPVRLVGAEGETRVAAADVAAAVGALRSAGRLEVEGADGKRLGIVSLKGASAALLYMDGKQRRTGTATALVRPGTRPPRPGSAPALPVVTARPLSSAPPLSLSAAGLAALRRKHGCTIDEVGGPEEATTHGLAPAETLLLLACGSGAYNLSYVPFVLRGGRPARAEIAAFDVKPGWWAEEGKPILINAYWDGKRGLLSSFSKGRGLGDCGTVSDYAWDGRAFRLVEQSEMSECRGSTDYITTWRAKVVRK